MSDWWQDSTTGAMKCKTCNKHVWYLYNGECYECWNKAYTWGEGGSGYYWLNQQGWQCPKCLTVWAPSIICCTCQKNILKEVKEKKCKCTDCKCKKEENKDG